MKGCMAIVLAMYQDELYILSLAWAVYILPNECLYHTLTVMGSTSSYTEGAY